MTDIPTLLGREIGRDRVISFARFMEIALYCPEIGYYERPEQRIGRKGDFYTSVSVGNLLGELLAFQFGTWIEALGRRQVHLVEAGAHDGQLAFDILTWMQESRPNVFGQTQFWLVEPSSRRQAWQQGRLEQFAGRVRWFRSLDELPSAGVEGIIFSNELLDAFPVHILRWDALEGRWREWGVGLKGGEFAWERMPADPDFWREELQLAGMAVPPELAAHLPDGFTIEISPLAARWWRNAASRLRLGRVVTIDYGGIAEELLSPQRHQGTLRAFAGHRISDDVLANPGEKDLTAHVNFTQIIAAGEQSGLKLESLLTQSAFLTRIAEQTFAPGAGFGSWTPARTRQLQTLTHPEHLGRSFRVLVQTRHG